MRLRVVTNGHVYRVQRGHRALVSICWVTLTFDGWIKNWPTRQRAEEALAQYHRTEAGPWRPVE